VAHPLDSEFETVNAACHFHHTEQNLQLSAGMRFLYF